MTTESAKPKNRQCPICNRWIGVNGYEQHAKACATESAKAGTPRTDAESMLHYMDGIDGTYATREIVLADFARELERELSELTGHIREDVYQNMSADIASLTTERDRVCELHKGLMAEADKRAEQAEAALSACQHNLRMLQISHSEWQSDCESANEKNQGGAVSNPKKCNCAKWVNLGAGLMGLELIRESIPYDPRIDHGGILLGFIFLWALAGLICVVLRDWESLTRGE